MSQLIDAAVAKSPDGLVVSVPDYDALKDSLAAATDAGIPIITINSGSDVYQEIGALTHVGQDETVAGEGAGAQLAEEGATKVICINQEVGNAGLDARCAGAKDGDRGGRRDARGAAGRPQRRRRGAEHDQLGAAVRPATSTASWRSARPARRRRWPPSRTSAATPSLATFDLSPEVLEAIEAGDMAFAVDQQQYLQGYLPIVFLTLYASNLNTVGGGRPVLTGPGFVTPDNAAQVKDLAAAGTR